MDDIPVVTKENVVTDVVSQEQKTQFICDNINELRRNYRKEILQTMIGSQIPKNKIDEKGGGTQVKIVDIPKELINIMYNYIKKKIEVNEFT
jgi:hypothetical protein